MDCRCNSDEYGSILADESDQALFSYMHCRTAETAERIKGDHMKKSTIMLYYALVFFLVAIVAGYLGFGVLAGKAAWIVKSLFLVSLAALIITLVHHLRLKWRA